MKGVDKLISIMQFLAGWCLWGIVEGGSGNRRDGETVEAGSAHWQQKKQAFNAALQRSDDFSVTCGSGQLSDQSVRVGIRMSPKVMLQRPTINHRKRGLERTSLHGNEKQLHPPFRTLWQSGGVAAENWENKS